MWRAFFLAMGISICILGLECLWVDQIVVGHAPNNLMRAFSGVRGKVIAPPDGAPWILLGAGVVTLIYSFTIPKRWYPNGV